MKKKLSKKVIKSISEKMNQVLIEHGIKDHYIGKYSLTPRKNIVSAAHFCGVNERPCIDPATGNMICRPIDEPC